MKRVLAAFALTIAGLYFVVSFRSTPVKSSIAAPPAPTRSAAATQPESTVAPVAAAPPADRTIDGPTIWNQYGPVQVAVTFQGKRITNISTLQMPSDHPRSQYISQTVAPWLKQEVLQAQSAQIDSVSGATFTSEAYAQSLQGAIDKANA